VNDLVVRRIGRLTTWVQPRLTEAAVVIRDGRVAWVGADCDLPGGLGEGPELDAGGAAVLPGFVDCHTHAVWAGSRRDDLVGRLEGASYRPGGIAATVAATRAASTDAGRSPPQQRVEAALALGTTTMEIKSGYGLTPDDELRLLDVASSLTGPTVTVTYLGAHVVPEGRGRAEYVEEVVGQLPSAVDHGAAWCDVFCDDGAFSVEEARVVLSAARRAGLGLRMHAEQLSHTGAALLAAELGCASADHLDHATPEDAAALARAEVIGVLVPVTSLYTRSGRWDHARILTDAGCTLAIATDCNPGSAWCESMPYAVQVACLGMGLGVDEALRAATLGGAAALRRADIGQLGSGARGDLIVVASDHEADLVAHLGARVVETTVVAGAVVGNAAAS
jgi:imidazolonepropionase